MLMSAIEYRESLRRYHPTVFIDGRRVEQVADEPALRPGVNAIALTYDYALRPDHRRLMTAIEHSSGRTVNRMSHIDRSSGDENRVHRGDPPYVKRSTQWRRRRATIPRILRSARTAGWMGSPRGRRGSAGSATWCFRARGSSSRVGAARIRPTSPPGHRQHFLPDHPAPAP